MQQTGVKLSSSDIIRITCTECGEVEVCPSVLLEEYEKLEQSRKLEQSGSDKVRSEPK
jgi:hypothetical protein